MADAVNQEMGEMKATTVITGMMELVTMLVMMASKMMVVVMRIMVMAMKG